MGPNRFISSYHIPTLYDISKVQVNNVA